MQLIIRYLAFFFSVFFATFCIAQEIPKQPNPPRLVNDFANVLTEAEEASLEQKLVQFDDSTSTQVAVITMKTLDGYTVEEVALKFLRDWGVGRKGKNNGVVILAAIDDRKINIQTGYGVEGVLPDLVCKRIITKDIIPAFKRQSYYEGFDNATTSIIKISKNEFQNDPSEGGGEDAVIIFVILMIFMFIIFISIMRRRRGNTVLTRRGYTDWDGGGWWYLPGGGGNWGGNDDNRGGGGGWDFGGFGGGDGGGGGASGDW